jgi:hypothetical protein
VSTWDLVQSLLSPSVNIGWLRAYPAFEEYERPSYGEMVGIVADIVNRICAGQEVFVFMDSSNPSFIASLNQASFEDPTI